MTPRILLLGGHGKISLLMTPKLLARSWNLTSVIRDPAQKAAIQEAGKAGPGKLDVLVESLDEVKSESDAKRILDLVKPDWVIWSAGTPLPLPLPCLPSRHAPSSPLIPKIKRGGRGVYDEMECTINGTFC